MASQVSIVIKQTGASEVQTEIKNIGDTAEKQSGKIGKLSGALGNIASTAGGFVVGQGLTKLPGLISDSTQAASDSAESMSKAQTIFGDGFGAIDTFAKGAADNIGLSKKAAYDATGTFGNMFVQLGIGKDKAASMSTSMVGLAADFASFHNADISDVIDAQTSAFRGEYDALQRYVPTISAAAVEQEALRETGKKTSKELTDQDKALAVNALMFKNAGDALGDFSRTKEGDANKTRILQAKYEDLQAALGAKLLPIQIKVKEAILEAIPPAIALGQAFADKVGPPLERVANFLNDKVLPPLKRLGEWFVNNETAMQTAAVVIGTVLVAAFAAWAVSAGAAAVATILAAAPVLLVVAAIAVLAAGIFLLIKNWDDITKKVPALGTAFDAIKAGLIAFGAWIVSDFVPFVKKIYDATSEWVAKAIAWVKDHWGEIKAPFVAFGTWVTTTFVPYVKQIYDQTVYYINLGIQWVKDHWDEIKGVIEPGLKLLVTIVTEQLKLFKEAVINGGVLIKDQFKLIWDGISGAFSIFKDIFTGDWGKLKTDLVGLATDIKNDVLQGFRDLMDGITNLGGDFLSAGAHIGAQLIEGLKGAFEGAAGIASDIAGAIKDALIGAINHQVIDRVNGITIGLPDILGGYSWSPGIPYLSYARGGMVPGSGFGDSVPAMLTPGEYVLPRDVVDDIRRGQRGSGATVIELHIHGDIHLAPDQDPTVELQRFGYGFGRSLAANGVAV